MVERESRAGRCILVNQQLMNEVSARSRLGDWHRGVRHRIIRHLLADGGDGPLTGRTTGTVNPGVVWVSRYLQVEVEAIVPIDPIPTPTSVFAHRPTVPSGDLSRLVR
jgi:hypothetical protein